MKLNFLSLVLLFIIIHFSSQFEDPLIKRKTLVKSLLYYAKIKKLDSVTRLVHKDFYIQDKNLRLTLRQQPNLLLAYLSKLNDTLDLGSASLKDWKQTSRLYFYIWIEYGLKEERETLESKFVFEIEDSIEKGTVAKSLEVTRTEIVFL